MSLRPYVMVASCGVNVATVLVVALGLFAAAAPPGAHAAAAASPQLLAKVGRCRFTLTSG